MDLQIDGHRYDASKIASPQQKNIPPPEVSELLSIDTPPSTLPTELKTFSPQNEAAAVLLPRSQEKITEEALPPPPLSPSGAPLVQQDMITEKTKQTLLEESSSSQEKMDSPPLSSKKEESSDALLVQRTMTTVSELEAKFKALSKRTDGSEMTYRTHLLDYLEKTGRRLVTAPLKLMTSVGYLGAATLFGVITAGAFVGEKILRHISNEAEMLTKADRWQRVVYDGFFATKGNIISFATRLSSATVGVLKDFINLSSVVLTNREILSSFEAKVGQFMKQQAEQIGKQRKSLNTGSTLASFVEDMNHGIGKTLSELSGKRLEKPHMNGANEIIKGNTHYFLKQDNPDRRKTAVPGKMMAPKPRPLSDDSSEKLS